MFLYCLDRLAGTFPAQEFGEGLHVENRRKQSDSRVYELVQAVEDLAERRFVICGLQEQESLAVEAASDRLRQVRFRRLDRREFRKQINSLNIFIARPYLGYARRPVRQAIFGLHTPD